MKAQTAIAKILSEIPKPVTSTDLMGVKDRPDIETIGDLSDLLWELQTGIFNLLGIKKVYIGGGSARGLLDHVLRGKHLVMRDFDIFMIADQQVTEDYCRKIGRTLEGGLLGRFSEKDLRPRPRANPKLDEMLRYNYNAGFGFFWKNGHRTVDLSIFHSEEDMLLNGILDIDRIRFPLTYPMGLADWVGSLLRQRTYEAALKLGMIEDQYAGYPAWVEGSPSISNINEIRRDPVQGAIRVLRAVHKIEAINLEDFESALKECIETSQRVDRLQTTRNFLKALGDPKAPAVLKSLQKTGMLAKWSAGLDSFIAETSETEISAIFDAISDTAELPRGVLRFRALLNLLPAESLLSLLSDLELARPKEALQWREEFSTISKTR